MSKYFVHESSFIDQPCEIGENTKIWHFSHIMSNAVIGKDCIIAQNVFIASGVILGDYVKVQNNVSIYFGVICEDEVFLGPSMVFTNVINPRSFIERKDEFKQTVVKRGASIGANTTIICGNTIGRYTLVGAGSVVTKDTPDFSFVYGVPAKQTGWVCKCSEKLVFENKLARCTSCGSEYEMTGDTVVKERERC
ncbi:hexapeptide transferase family protein [Alkaliphilus metalliredigens QYMF]|uniref:Hexapeptide transferase family protein n=1 Tax=Alkaliphilus metalliredigens (strain QYMF) TaxID=293826 RepID=A6TTQ5_ALKMQ|nr:acyltransferase [Alkaliphilus metalliredigens]ABR49573.1 hexapeptide transferase family protein [Alkaliphilus metalliredigens QYMF]